MNKVNRQRPFGAKDKWSYAMGDLGCNMSFALNSYLMLFYTQYIGLDLGTWGIIILLLKIWDAINDPIMGALMDALKPGKRGKFKTYIYYGSFVLLFSGALCFLPIPSAPYPIKVLVCVVGYLIWDMAYTVVNVPYGNECSYYYRSDRESTVVNLPRNRINDREYCCFDYFTVIMLR